MGRESARRDGRQHDQLIGERVPRARSRAGRRLSLAVGCTLGVLAGSALPAQADLSGLAGELTRIQDEVAALRRVAPAQVTDPGRLGQFEVRLGQLEEELRRLTGRVEQLEYGQRTLEDRFDQLIGDLDARLRAMEGAPSGTAGAAVAPPPEARAAGPAPAPPAGTEPQVLGQIPRSAVLALPRPDPAAIPPPPSTRELGPQQQYDAAMELLRAGDYAGAEGGLQLFLDLQPDHALAPNAAYWLAETYYVRKNYPAAAAAFARNYQTYGKTAAKASDNLLKLGMSLEGLGENAKACLSYAELAKEFPNAPAHIQQALARERDRAECV
jgi:tol-pal system protein YbgF